MLAQHLQDFIGAGPASDQVSETDYPINFRRPAVDILQDAPQGSQIAVNVRDCRDSHASGLRENYRTGSCDTMTHWRVDVARRARHADELFGDENYSLLAAQ
jgi:hypothetical protein